MSIGTQSGKCAARRAAVALAVLVAVVGLAGFLYSPWHLHNGVSPVNCPFTQFEKTAWTEESASAVVVEAAWRTVAVVEQSDPVAPERAAAAVDSTRAPPEFPVTSLTV